MGAIGGPVWRAASNPVLEEDVEDEQGLSLAGLVDQHLADIQELGYTTVQVAADGLAPGWGYTVGLWQRFRHPELICVGMPAQACAAVLHQLAQRVADGAVLPPGEPDSGLFRGRPHRYLEVGPEWRSASDWFNLGRILLSEGWGAQGWPPTLQVLWPDEHCRFPDEEGVEPALGLLQPPLSGPVTAQHS
jgi:hypothetical protein